MRIFDISPDSLFKCDDIKNQFDYLSNDQKNYQTFWNKKITRDSLLVKATRNETTTILKVKKIVAILKKRKATKLEKNVHIDTNICFLKQRGTVYVDTYQDNTEVVSSVNFKEIKYSFQDVVTWSKNEIEELFHSVHRQIESKLFIF